MAFFGIILSLILLVILIYRGVSVLVVSPLMAMLAVLFSGDMPIIVAWTGPLMTATADFIKNYFPVFLVGAIFGLLMSTSGCAKVIAQIISKLLGPKHACTAVIAASFILVYGGVSVFVVVFAILPIAENIFKVNHLPRRLIPAAIVAGAMPAYAAPGAAQFINTIPIPLLGTNIYSGFVSGMIATVFWIALSMIYMGRQIRHSLQNQNINTEQVNEQRNEKDLNQPSTFWAIFPLLLVIVLNFILTLYFEQESVKKYYQEFGGVQGIWAITISLSVTIFIMIIALRKYLKQPIADMTKGAADSLLPIFNTAVQVGYGGVIKSLSAFMTIKVMLLSLMAVVPKLIVVALTAALVAGVVGSASGGTGILMEVFGDEFLAIANEYHIPLSSLHRVIIFGANILGTLPHSGLIITLLLVCGLTHRETYKQIFIVSVLFPLFATILLLLCIYLGI